MIDHPDFLNVRRLVFISATAPIAFLLMLSLIDVSWHHFRVWQSAGVWCTQSTASHTVKVYGAACLK